MIERKKLFLGIGITVSVVIVLVCAAAVATEVAYASVYRDKIYPGVRALGISLDGLTRDEARAALQKATDVALEKGIPFKFRDKVFFVSNTRNAGSPDLAHDLITYNLDQAAIQAYAFGRDNSWLQNVLEQMRARTYPKNVPVDVSIHDVVIEASVRDALGSDMMPPSDATFQIAMVTGSTPFVHVEPEKPGVDVQLDGVVEKVARAAKTLKFTPIEVQSLDVSPKVKAKDLEPVVKMVEEWLARPSLTFTYEGKGYPVSTSQLAAWLVATSSDAGLTVAIDEARFVESMRSIPGVEQEGTRGKLVIQDGKIVSFAPGVPGRALDVQATLKPVMAEWPATSTFPLVVVASGGQLEGEDPQRLGIKEIIGVGRSNFSGSPANRRKNIKLGVEHVDGTIIGPGEEFSMLKVLGPVDGEHGWLPELVIKGNKTTPEFGGGLCQVGTTAFRGAVNSGLKITQRQNHSYRVRYYEPAGTDATIYDPAPDFRFMNDTAHSVLIHAYIKGDEATFEFWGTKDGRKVDPIKPVVYNIVAPPPMKLVETTDLPVGQKKCTETAHAGADASFTYHVVYGDGTEFSQDFKSHYKPWQAVCLVGVAGATTGTSGVAVPLTP